MQRKLLRVRRPLRRAAECVARPFAQAAAERVNPDQQRAQGKRVPSWLHIWTQPMLDRMRPDAQIARAARARWALRPSPKHAAPRRTCKQLCSAGNVLAQVQPSFLMVSKPPHQAPLASRSFSHRVRVQRRSARFIPSSNACAHAKFRCNMEPPAALRARALEWGSAEASRRLQACMKQKAEGAQDK